MIRFLMLVTVVIMAAWGCQRAGTRAGVTYPATDKRPVIDDYHGVKVEDPYRWMEALDAPDVASWVAAQNGVTEPYLKTVPLRGHFQTRLTELWNYARVGLPRIEGNRLFYQRNSGLQRQAPLFVRQSVDAPAKLVIDPNVISEDGSISLAQWSPSPDGRLLAYGLSEGGADWETVHVREVDSGRDLDDEVRWIRFSEIAWTGDSKGFFYSRYPEPPKNKVLEAALSGHALYYHRIGTPQSQDVLVYQRKDRAGWIVTGLMTEDGRYLLVLLYEGAENRNALYVADLKDPKMPRIGAPITTLRERNDAEYWPLGNNGSTILLRTDKDAPSRKVVAVDVARPDAPWRDVIPERKEAMENATIVAGRIVTQYLVDVQSRLSIFALDGTPQRDVTLPTTGTVAALGGRQDGQEIWYSFTSPVTPTTVFHHDPAKNVSTPFEAPVLPIDLNAFETRALFATSKDGTRVPFFVTSRKGLELNGKNPTMLYGYGGFSVSMTPAYRQDVPAWLERGGVWVTASMRGGAEYGEAWHQAGMLDRKQNVFDDFIAVAEQLIASKYASPSTLAIMGGSNGGLLVGAVMQQRPGLFGAALPEVGVMDMLRYDKFTGGALWTTEYGSAANAAQFQTLFRYSPVHNVKAGTCYPATLVTTADHDDRVVPSHSFKFTAATQAAQGCDKPILIRVEVQGSHGYRPTDKLIAERADEWSFAALHTGMK